MGLQRTFAVNLIKLREAKGYSRKEAAKALGISYEKLWWYESGKTQPRLETLKNICDMYQYNDIYRLLTEDL